MDRLLIPPRLRPYHAERFIIQSRLGSSHFKLFQVLFTDKSGGFYVNFPYFRETKGIAALALLPATVDGNEQQIDLRKGGRLTSHQVKYAHHVDGRAHFSQDGKVKTELVKQAVPLGKLTGHVFSVYIKGIDAFTPIADVSQTSLKAKRMSVILDFGTAVSGWIKVIGYWYSRRQALDRYQHGEQQGFVGPVVEHPDSDGTWIQRGILAPLDSDKSDNVLMIEARTIPEFRMESGPMLLFLGGFDDDAVVGDPSVASTALMFKYPAANFEELQQTLQSIDFQP